MTDTPIYVEALREAKRRTKRNSPERKILDDMDLETAPVVAYQDWSFPPIA